MAGPTWQAAWLGAATTMCWALPNGLYWLPCLCRKNGKDLGVAFKGVTTEPLWPTIGMHR